jgi:hypothetical protein
MDDTAAERRASYALLVRAMIRSDLLSVAITVGGCLFLGWSWLVPVLTVLLLAVLGAVIIREAREVRDGVEP